MPRVSHQFVEAGIVGGNPHRSEHLEAIALTFGGLGFTTGAGGFLHQGHPVTPVRQQGRHTGAAESGADYTYVVFHGFPRFRLAVRPGAGVHRRVASSAVECTSHSRRINTAQGAMTVATV